METEDFFSQQAEQSKVKSQIVAKYLWAWCKVMIATEKRMGRADPKIAYIDLFCGPGRYKDGTPSTPILIIEKTVSDKTLCRSLMMFFNDKVKDFASQLEEVIDGIPNIESLRYKPRVYNIEVGADFGRIFENVKMTPTLCFIDPTGYKGITQRLLKSILKDWGSECIFFFNFNRIRPALSNPKVHSRMTEFFGEERAESLKSELEQCPPSERETVILEELCQVLMGIGGRFVLPFCFKDARGSRTSHHLIFVTKHELGYEIMKDIMAKYSSSTDQGVPSFVYNPASERAPFLFELSRPLDDLASMLQRQFSGERISIEQLYKKHHVGRPYIRKNYKEAVQILLRDNKVNIVSTKDGKRKSLTYQDEVIFP